MKSNAVRLEPPMETMSATSLPGVSREEDLQPAKSPIEGIVSQNGACLDPELAAVLEDLKPVGFIHGKPVFVVPTTTVLNMESGFQHKLLCDGPTFTAGSVCVYSCVFCYVVCILQKNKYIQKILKKTRLSFGDIVVRRENPVGLLRKQLTTRGKPKFKDPVDCRVIYASPLVDVAPNMEMVRETVGMCLVILELTNWQIRLLSKSPLLWKVAELIPAEYKHRMIYGFSTGTLNNAEAAAIEVGTPLVGKRLEALYKLHDQGYRTYGMACPVLPQHEVKEYAARMAETLRVNHREDVWVEILNSRHESMQETEQALRKAGFKDKAELFAKATRTPEDLENYARETFLAFAEVIPANKLHFLQYVRQDTLPWWRAQEARGAVLLGQAVEASATAAGVS